MTHPAAAADTAQASWLGQPRGLIILSLTQMWEIFSYYGMRALLIYYMTKQLLMGQQQASLVYGLYTAVAYFTPILGGVIADRWLGRRRAVILGGCIMALGHFLMASESLFYLALGTIALGNGLFLPSLPSQIEGIYQPGDPRRSGAYNIYYVGINVGGLLAPLVCGTLGELYGWHWGFGAAGIGMVIGLAIYVLGGRYLPPEVHAPDRAAPVAANEPTGWDLRRRLLVLLAIGLCVMLFRGAYEQVGNTIALWADTGIDRSLGSFTIPMTWFQSLNPFLVITLTPLFVAFWARRAGREPAAASKMALGALGVALAYLMLAVVSAATPAGQTSWLWLGLFFLILTAGELMILPIGLGLFARLAPSRYRATTVAAWFFAAFGGNLLAGALGTLWSRSSPSGYFLLMAAVAAGAALLLFLLSGPSRRIEAEESGNAGVVARI